MLNFLSAGSPSLLRKDRNRHGGGLLMYIKEDIPQKELSFNLPSDIEVIIIELNIDKIKWLVCGLLSPSFPI